MRWIRTWPERIPPGRSYVVDSLPRVIMAGHDYAPVLAGLDGDTVIVEWDMAVSREDIARFTLFCQAEPGRVHVAPYKLYPVSTNLPGPVWAHRRAAGGHPWIAEGMPYCDLFGFGLIYLPNAIVRKYLATDPGMVSDGRFSRWHHAAGLGPVPVHWDVRPVHLHY